MDNDSELNLKFFQNMNVIYFFSYICRIPIFARRNMSILKKMLVRLPVKKSYLRMAWDAMAKGQSELANQLFKMAYDQETESGKRTEAAWNIYVYYKNRERYHEAYLWCERAAKLGYVKAMRVLGKAYYYGLGIVPNYRVAFKWFREGSESGDMTCTRLLGECYVQGRGVLANAKKGYEYLRKAYEAKEQGSYYWIGLAYRYGGAGYPLDIHKAIEIWEEGVPNSRCLCELGKCYYWGCGLAKDKTLAYKYFKKVSDQGKDHADDFLSPDKSGLRSEEEVEQLTNFRNASKETANIPEEGASAVLEGNGHTS